MNICEKVFQFLLFIVYPNPSLTRTGTRARLSQRQPNII